MRAIARNRGRGRWAATLAFALTAVWLAAGCAALSRDLAAATHDCCDVQQGDAACRSLCASTNGPATPAVSADAAPAPSAETRDVASLPRPARAPAFARLDADFAPDRSVPIYLLNASFLI